MNKLFNVITNMRRDVIAKQQALALLIQRENELNELNREIVSEQVKICEKKRTLVDEIRDLNDDIVSEMAGENATGIKEQRESKRHQEMVQEMQVGVEVG